VKFLPAGNWNGFSSLSYSVRDASDYSAPVDGMIVINPVNDIPQASVFTEPAMKILLSLLTDGISRTWMVIKPQP
jgi:hypothetical protein